MRPAAIGLLSLLVLALCWPRFAGAGQADAQTAQVATEDSLQGCWTGQEGGGTAVYCFSGSRLDASSPAAVWSHGRLAVRDGVLSVSPEQYDFHYEQLPPLPGVQGMKASLEDGVLVVGGTRLARLPKPDASFGLGPDEARLVDMLASRAHAQAVCRAEPAPEERKFVQDLLDADARRRALYITQRLGCAFVLEEIYNRDHWCRSRGVEPGIGGR